MSASDSAPRPLPGPRARATDLSETTFNLLRGLIADRIGVFFDDAKRDMLADKLSEAIAARGLSSYLDYYYLLRYDAEAERHWAELANRLAVPETYFWRQAEHFEALAGIIVPRHFEESPGSRLRIWSAACCTGEEPLSIAIALAEARWLERSPIEIVASDASPALIERARQGLYGERSFRSLPQALRDKYFRREDGRWRIDRGVHERVRWTVANLMNADEIAPLATADVIFCRNVFIYFSTEAIQRVVRHFGASMPLGGHLFLGAAESLTRLTTGFVLEQAGQAFVYVNRRTPGPGPRARPSAVEPGA